MVLILDTARNQHLCSLLVLGTTVVSELYNNQAVAQNRFTLVSAELHTLTNKVLHDEEPTDEEFGKICISLLRVNMRYNYTSISEHRQEILDYAGINRLYDLINTNVLRKRRQYLIKEIKEDYIHSMDLINSNANLYINEGQGFLQAIVAGHEQNQESINCIFYERNIRHNPIGHFSG